MILFQIIKVHITYLMLYSTLKLVLYTQRKKSYQQLEIWGQIAFQLCIIKL